MLALFHSRTARLAVLYFFLAAPVLAQTPSWSSLVQQPLHPAIQRIDIPEPPQVHTGFEHSGVSPDFLPTHSRSSVNLEWEAWLDGHGNNDYATDIAVGTEDGVWVTGWSIVEPGDNQYVTVRYTPDGDEMWRATYDDPSGQWDEAYAIAVDLEENAFVTGRSRGAGGFRAVTIKYNPEGEELWSRRSTVMGYTKAIDVDTEGNAYVAGVRFAGDLWDYVLTKYSPDGNEEWVITIPAPGANPNTGIPMAVAGDDTIYIGGAIHNADVGSSGVDYYVLKYDGDGNQLWNFRYEVPGGSNWFAVMTLDMANNVYIGGGSNDRRFIKITAEGELAWEAFIGGDGGAVGALVTDADNNVFVGGVTGCGNGVGCFSVSKYDPSGTLLWDQGYPGYYRLVNVVNALSIDGQGHVYATGRSEKETNIQTDYVTAKYHSDGGELWLHRYDAGEFASGSAEAIEVFQESEAAYVTGASNYDFLTLRYTSGVGTLTLTPTEVDFGTLFLGASSSAEIQVHNSTMGHVALEVSLTDPTVGVSLESPSSITLGPGMVEDIMLTFNPEEAGEIFTTLQVVPEAGESLEATLTGIGQHPPVGTLSVEDLTFNLDPISNPVETRTVTLGNTAVDGGADLEFSVSYSSARVVDMGALTAEDLSRRHSTHLTRANESTEAQLYTRLSGTGVTHRRGTEATITHSESMEILKGVGVACVPGEYSMQNSYWRMFDLSQQPQISGTFSPRSVEIGVEMATAPLGSSVNLYKLNGNLDPDNLIQVTQKAFTLEPGDQYLFTVELDPAEFNSTEVLVVEWSIDSGEEKMGMVFPGSNYFGQTGPTYISSKDECGLDGIVDLADAGFPDMHWVMSVTGETGAGLLTITPMEGAVPAESSTDLSVTADATTLEDGIYPMLISIWTNDPEQPVLEIDVEVSIVTVSNENDGTPLTFDLKPNFPNPFSDQTTIEFALPSAEHVMIEVIDMTGRRVAVLVDEQLEAARHQVTWNANGLASGVYLYRMQAGSFKKTLRTTIVR